LQTQTTYGRRLASVGSNADAARLVGIDVRHVVLGSFVFAGLLAGMAGILQVAWSGGGDPSIGGISLILPGLAAAFLGSTAFTPGRYNVPGTLLGLFFVGATVSGLALLGAQVWVNPVFNGCIVIAAVSLSSYFRARRTGEREVGA
jgi:ribose transport system permease protein